MKKVILFDIDYTLFDTAAFRERLFNSILGVLEQKASLSGNLQVMYDEVSKELGYFNPKVFSEKLAKKIKREDDAKIIKEAIFAEENFKGGLYKESLNVLEQLSKIAIIGIFSRGHSEFQKKKIDAITHLLDTKHIHIIVDKHVSLPKIIKRYKNENLYLVDDALDVLYAAWKLKNEIVTIWVKRGRFALDQKPIAGFKPSAIVENLEEVMLVISGS